MKNLRGQFRDEAVPDSADHYADWPEPQPLQRQLPPAPKYPIEALGSVLAPAAKEIASAMGAPEAMVGQCLLAASSLAVQGLRDVEIHGRRYPSSLFFLTIAGTGERKSAVDRIALKPVEAHQKRLIRGHKEKLEKYYRRVALHKAKQREALREEDPASRQRALYQLGDQPPRPRLPILTCDEPSVEGLFKVLATGHPSVGIFTDEGGRFIGGYAMSREKSVNTAATLSSMWDGQSLKRVRATEDPAILTGRRVSLHLMMQPNIAEKLVSNEEMLEQGLPSRCLVTRPNSLVGRRKYVPVDVEDLPGVKAYYARLQELFGKPLPKKAGALNPQRLSLTKEAKARWTKFHNGVEQECAVGGRFAQILGFAAKAAEHALRLAAVLATVDDPDCTRIELKVMDNAIKVVKYYLKEASRLYGIEVPDPRLELAEKTLQWLQTRPEEKFPLKLIYQRGPTRVRDAAMARSIMKILVDHGWARLLDSEEERQGLGKEVYIVRKK